MKKDTPPSPVFLMERPRAARRALGGGVRGGEAGLATLSDLPSPRTSAETEYRIKDKKPPKFPSQENYRKRKPAEKPISKKARN